MKLVSPDGKVSISPHPSKVESLLNMGWKEEAAPKEIKSSSKKSKAKFEEVLDENIEE
jgi:hypothetical protein